LHDAGVEVLTAPPNAAGLVDLSALLLLLGSRGLTRLLIDGGSRIAAALLRADLVDRLIWFHAPLLLGNEGLPAVDSLDRDLLAAMPRFERLATEAIGEDVMTLFRVRRPAKDGAPKQH
jgi:diaminohydroxyphosphoribosylaminopyrimidine deaminase/5-amino-6-(5-phosphoribosylamino)uracil reductase